MIIFWNKKKLSKVWVVRAFPVFDRIIIMIMIISNNNTVEMSRTVCMQTILSIKFGKIIIFQCLPFDTKAG